MELHGGKSQSPPWSFRGPRQGAGFLTEACAWAGIWQGGGRKQLPAATLGLLSEQGEVVPRLLPSSPPLASEGPLRASPPHTLALLMKSARHPLGDAPQEPCGFSDSMFGRLGLSWRAN